MGYIALIGLLYLKPKQTIDEVKVKKMKRGRKRYVDPNQLTLNFDKPQRLLELQSKSIRELKQLASQAKVKRYSYLTKAQLIQALSAV
ncbi:MAG: Rho termination factor N-terminal domain-containing protein [Microcystaceae cyanobacterium]